MVRQTGWHDGGKDNRCFAAKGKCPFGGSTGTQGHFPPTAVGKKMLEQYLEDQYGRGNNPRIYMIKYDENTENVEHPQAYIPGTDILVDEGMVPILFAINKMGLESEWSCQGHTATPGEDPTSEEPAYINFKTLQQANRFKHLYLQKLTEEQMATKDPAVQQEISEFIDFAFNAIEVKPTGIICRHEPGLPHSADCDVERGGVYFPAGMLEFMSDDFVNMALEQTRAKS